jgi:hypothetical protein
MFASYWFQAHKLNTSVRPHISYSALHFTSFAFYVTTLSVIQNRRLNWSVNKKLYNCEKKRSHLISGTVMEYTRPRRLKIFGISPKYEPTKFYVHMPVHCTSRSINYPTRCDYTQSIYCCRPLYMFRVVTLPIVRSKYNRIHSIW